MPTEPNGRSFLGDLRPFPRHLYESSFLELVEAVKTLAPSYAKADQVNREVMSALWAICTLGRSWGLHPDGMLQRNHLISDKDTRTLEDWIDRLSLLVFTMLDGADPDAMAGYESRG
jgi:hypothetical protein